MAPAILRRVVHARTFNLCLLGFGNVNRTLVDLLGQKREELQRRGISFRITGVASRRLGWLVNPEGFDVCALSRDPTSREELTADTVADLQQWLAAARPNVLFEATSLNVENGEPAISHIRAALEQGVHAITANKGPIVHAYRELRNLAAARSRQFLFESTVMDGAPIFSMFRHGLPAVTVNGFCGILNSTTNVILSGMEEGRTMEQALKHAQDLGIAETDASYDIDGWDAAVKVAALVNVAMDIPLKPDAVAREGIRHLSADRVRSARAEGRPYKLVCRARRKHDSNNAVDALVRPEQVPATDAMSLVSGTSSIVRFETDVLPGLTITEENPGLYTTAYGMLGDFIRIVAP